MTLPRMNGSSSAHSEHAWMRQNVQQFFSSCNWDDSSPEVQELLQATTTGEEPLSLTLKVEQFFQAVNWDGNTIGSVNQFQPPQPHSPDTFTLDDFSDLF